ncbi:MAG: hypothetical protein E7223_02890 [Clostridiales bacterium]|nr:hypothetical protein [Clostridiales bacterium]
MGMGSGKRKGGCGRTSSEFLGLLLLVLGVTTLCAFVLPIKLWLVLLAGAMIFFGYRIFTS